MNVSKEKRDALVKKIGEIEEALRKGGGEDAARLLGYAESLKKEIFGKKYGLVFEEPASKSTKFWKAIFPS